ncbi:MAG: molybdate ABC transporter substrate-binding protein [Armatimonadetes bacterium]|nr:molybdate ABC transporter substrate-binding protein [Armatimonadota bacterium]
MSPVRRALIASFALLLLPACAQSATVRIFAAASLSDAFREIGRNVERARPGNRVEFSFAGSPLLRTQIERGAPADVFASADFEQMRPLQRRGLVHPPRVFARNRLVVVTPATRNKVRSLRDLARPGMKIVVAGPTVPAGRYTAQILRKMSGGGSFSIEFQRRVEANVVSRETNVRAVLSKVALGEADAGFVYATDAATAKGRVRALPIPASMNVTAAYPVAVLRASRVQPQASAFVKELLSPRGQAVLRKHGFLR